MRLGKEWMILQNIKSAGKKLTSKLLSYLGICRTLLRQHGLDLHTYNFQGLFNRYFGLLFFFHLVSFAKDWEQYLRLLHGIIQSWKICVNIFVGLCSFKNIQITCISYTSFHHQHALFYIHSNCICPQMGTCPSCSIAIQGD